MTKPSSLSSTFHYYCTRCEISGCSRHFPCSCWCCGKTDMTGPWHPGIPAWTAAHVVEHPAVGGLSVDNIV